MSMTFLAERMTLRLAEGGRGMMYISQQFEIHGPTEYKFQNGPVPARCLTRAGTEPDTASCP
eukprot:scaffold401_cov144-Skeletonema_dohrnii-CCMP3373.AAC.11